MVAVKKKLISVLLVFSLFISMFIGFFAIAPAPAYADAYSINYEGLTFPNVTQPTPMPANYDTLGTFPVAVGNPSRIGYTFRGWTVHYENSALADPSGPVTNYSVPDAVGGITTTEAIMLTANWQAYSYTITYGGLSFAGITGPTPMPTSYTRENTFPIAIGNPSRTGYTFDGWYVHYVNSSLTNPSGMVTNYSVPESVGGTTTTGNIELAANWRLGPYDILQDFPVVTDNNATNISAIINADYFTDFGSGTGSSVQVNGSTLNQGVDYTHKQGSTVITLTPSYLKTLINGTYNVTVNFASGAIATTTSLIVAIPGAATTTVTTTTANPKTGDSGNMQLWFLLSAICIVGITTITNRNRKHS